MHVLRCLSALIVTLGVVAATSGPASAAESYDSCGTNYIDAVPIVIATAGTWCLRHNVVALGANVHAIDIRTNNVTIDCNGFRLSNTAGPSTASYGIWAYGSVSNVTVRNCTITGFALGVSLSGNPPGGGHLVENNKVPNSRSVGIKVDAAASVIRRNVVTDTGFQPGSVTATGIVMNGGVDVIDNIVDGVGGDGSVVFSPYGIIAGDFTPPISAGSLIRGNRVRNLAPSGAGSSATGILVYSTGAWVRDNLVGQQTSTNGIGISCGTETRVRDNIVKNYTQGMAGQCDNDSGNVSY